MSNRMNGRRMSSSKQRSRLPLRHLRILIVDAAEDIREFTRSALEASAASVVLAQAVEAAIETYRQHPRHVLVRQIQKGTRSAI